MLLKQLLSAKMLSTYPVFDAYQHNKQVFAPTPVTLFNYWYNPAHDCLQQHLPIETTKPTKLKRKRRSFSLEQLDALEREFSRSQYKTRSQRFDLAQRLKLDEKQVKVWFQNRRMRFKREDIMPKPKNKQLPRTFQEEFENKCLSNAPLQSVQQTATAAIKSEIIEAFPPTPPYSLEADDSQEAVEEKIVLNKTAETSPPRSDLSELDEILEFLYESGRPTPPPSETGQCDFLKESSMLGTQKKDASEFTNQLTCMADTNHMPCNICSLTYNPYEQDVIMNIEQDLLATAEDFNQHFAHSAAAFTPYPRWTPAMLPMPLENPYQVPYYK